MSKDLDIGNLGAVQIESSKDDKSVSQTSDYVDENFELDETDELWGLNK